ncbi:MAG TPA: tetraacyldisaccharide 4'-kinase, partial [Phycisphaerales bacterium]|nr:tetraacyldisaccharide 4'-kinase [Phycisphaerales bacterium]
GRAECVHRWSELVVGDRRETIAWLGAKRVIALAAIGNPDAFVRQIEQANAVVCGQLVRRDHHSWSESDAAELGRLVASQSSVDAIVTTEKDWMKLRAIDWSTLPCPIVRPRVDVRFIRGEAELRERLLAAARRRPLIASR